MKSEEEIKEAHDKIVDLFDGSSELPALRSETLLDIIRTLEWVLEDNKNG